MVTALEALSRARKAFEEAAVEKLILGNDNHIGDIGEYWVRRHFEDAGQFKSYGPSKNASHDIELVDGTKVSVKTVTAWSKTGYGTQVRPLCGANWTILAAVCLDKALYPAKIALVPLPALIAREPFLSNETRRSANDSSTYPRFQWWAWLDDFVVYPDV